MILIVYCWGARLRDQTYMRGSTVQNQNNNNFRKAIQIQSGLNHGAKSFANTAKSSGTSSHRRLFGKAAKYQDFFHADTNQLRFSALV